MTFRPSIPTPAKPRRRQAGIPRRAVSGHPRRNALTTLAPPSAAGPSLDHPLPVESCRLAALRRNDGAEAGLRPSPRHEPAVRFVLPPRCVGLRRHGRLHMAAGRWDCPGDTLKWSSAAKGPECVDPRSQIMDIRGESPMVARRLTPVVFVIATILGAEPALSSWAESCTGCAPGRVIVRFAPETLAPPRT